MIKIAYALYTVRKSSIKNLKLKITTESLENVHFRGSKKTLNIVS